MLGGNWEDQNTERSAEAGGLACAVSEGSLRTSGTFVILNEDAVVLVSWGRRISRDYEATTTTKAKLCFPGILDADWLELVMVKKRPA